jgi:nucleoid-associated protein Lsr2
MMRSVTVTLVDDLDEAKAADETISFGLDGRDYEIDLSKAHAGELRKMASRYIAAARRAKTAVRQRPARRTQADRERARQIRAWAVEKGLMTTERGRIPEQVTREFEASRRAESSRLPVRPAWHYLFRRGRRRRSLRSLESGGRRYAPVGVSTNTGIVRVVFF